MIYRKLGNSDMDVSVVVLGCWGMGGTWGGADDEQSIATIRAGIEHGINLIDTAQPYGEGHSETVVGQGIRGLRDKVYIATKCGNYTENGQRKQDASASALRRQLEGSLKRLGVDYIDLYQMHWPDPNHTFKESFTELNKMREEGLIRYVGVSNFDGAQMDEASRYCPITSLQPPFSLLDRRIEAEILPYCEAHQIGTLTYGSIAAGALTGKFKERPSFTESDPRSGPFYPFFQEEQWPKTQAMVDVLSGIAQKRGVAIVEVAINWVLAQKGVTCAIVGAKTPEQVIANAAAGNWSLTAEEEQFIRTEYERIYGVHA